MSEIILTNCKRKINCNNRNKHCKSSKVCYNNIQINRKGWRIFVKLDDLRQIAANIQPPLTPEKHAQMRLLLREMGLDPDNLYQELEMTSPWVDTHRDTSFSNSGLNLHSHNFYELIYCQSSDGTEYLVGSERYRIRRGDIVAVPPGVSHRPLLPENMAEPYRRYVLWISPAFFEWFAQTFPHSAALGGPGRRMIRTEGTKWEHLEDVFRQGVEEAEHRRSGWEAAVAANTIQLIVQLQRMLEEHSGEPLRAEKPDLLERAMAYIEENLPRKITLADTARHFYISESTVSQLFRNKMGVSFYRCVTQRRLIAAKGLIAEGLALERVAARTGFTDYSTFYRAFRHEYGISPRQYRDLHNPGPQMKTR